MSSLGTAIRLTGKATLDLDQAVSAEHGPDPARLRAIVDQLYDAAAALMAAASDLEMGIES